MTYARYYIQRSMDNDCNVQVCIIPDSQKRSTRFQTFSMKVEVWPETDFSD